MKRTRAKRFVRGSPRSRPTGSPADGPTESSDATHAPSGSPAQAHPSRWLAFLRHGALWPAGIFLVAFVLRLIYVLQVRSSPFYGHEMMDPLYHDQWARAFAAGEPFVQGAYFRAPLYPWFLGTIYWLLGTSALVPRLVQAVLGSLSCCLLFLIGRQVFNRTVGLIAGFAAATYWTFLYFDAELLIVVLIVFVDLVLLWLLLYTGDRRNPWLWLASGVVLGVSAIARPNILLFAPAVLIWLAVMHRASWRRVLAYAGCFVVGCAAPILPVSIRNVVVGGDFALIATQGGVNFYIGNNPQSNGMTAIVPGTPGEWWAGYYATVERAEQAAGHKLTGSQVSRYYWGEARRFFRDQPGKAAGLLLKKLGLFWTRYEIPNNQDIYVFTDLYAPIVRFLPLGFWCVGSLGLLGLVLAMREPGRLFPLWGFVLVYMISVVMFFVTARYRVPVVAVLILLAGYALYWCVQRVRLARWPSLAFAGAALVLTIPLVAHVPAGTRTATAVGYQETGIALVHQGKFAEAEEMLTEALRIWPAQPKSWYGLGHMRILQGRYEEAQEYFQRALQIDPNYPQARGALGAALLWEGKLDAAIKELERALTSAGDQEQGGLRADLAAALILRGRLEEGLGQWQRAVQSDAGQVRRLLAPIQKLLRARRFAEAIPVLQACVKQAPDDVEFVTWLARLLATCPATELRDGPQAVRLAEHACELTDWQDAVALHTAAAAYFSVGRADDAVRWARQALELAAQRGRADLVPQIQAVLRRYEAATSQPTTTTAPAQAAVD